MISKSDNDGGHPVDLLLPFLDNALSPPEMDSVRKHLETCPPCQGEVTYLRDITSKLDANNNVFCPEPWELYDFVHSGIDTQGKIANHLSVCELCEDEVKSLNETRSSHIIPKQTWNRMKTGFPQAGAKPVAPGSSFWKMPKLSFSFLKFPALASAAAAAILCVVLLYPGGRPDFTVALSSESWERPTIKLMSPKADMELKPKGLPLKAKDPSPRPEGATSQPQTKPESAAPDTRPTDSTSQTATENSRPKAAIIILLEGKSTGLSPEQVDLLYQQIIPTDYMRNRFEFVPPRSVRESVNRNEIRTGSITELLDSLKKGLHLNETLLIAIQKKNGTLEVRSDLYDVQNAKLLKQTTETGVTLEQLPSRLAELSRF